eukprot:NODE_2248_length_540_cov_723.193483_g1721_i0.p1 GENE.NODE_2248_length_540_cov_723.193483_g1721_i0~~NODE_2248_length_540_cov_723.193483_g1721_i0.p1  ORF type:complete len:167 (+),score=18.37 NODE_2248_length_540_cov_723.193483_g1721_i0:25-501(+)
MGWFQDVTPVLIGNETIYTRKNDFIFHLIDGIGKIILNKGILSQYQPFCIDNNIYKNRKTIERKNKIVYIGNSYLYRIKSKQDKKICNDLEKIYDSTGLVSLQNVELIAKKYTCSIMAIKEILGYVEKDLLILKLAKLNIKFTFEIYGIGWESYNFFF